MFQEPQHRLFRQVNHIDYWVSYDGRVFNIGMRLTTITLCLHEKIIFELDVIIFTNLLRISRKIFHHVFIKESLLVIIQVFFIFEEAKICHRTSTIN